MNIRRSIPYPFSTLVQLTAGALTPARDEVRVAAEPAAPAPSPRSLFDRLDAWLWRARQHDLERALEHAPSVEAAERLLAERVGPFGRYL